MRADRFVRYVDHNKSQFGPEHHHDHLDLQSRSGNGICHQVNLERFFRPGGVLLAIKHKINHAEQNLR